MPGPSRPRRLWYSLLALPALGTLFPPFYAHEEPSLGGVPFFYWYHFLWVLISSVLTGIVYLATEK